MRSTAPIHADIASGYCQHGLHSQHGRAPVRFDRERLQAHQLPLAVRHRAGTRGEKRPGLEPRRVSRTA